MSLLAMPAAVEWPHLLLAVTPTIGMLLFLIGAIGFGTWTIFDALAKRGRRSPLGFPPATRAQLILGAGALLNGAGGIVRHFIDARVGLLVTTVAVCLIVYAAVLYRHHARTYGHLIRPGRDRASTRRR